ncbi:MAG: ParB N-terminal domain-containing protein [Pseudomonadota bacterium]
MAEDMLARGQRTPIQCHLNKTKSQPRLVLVEGRHRIEALKALGETTITAYLVQARKP